MIYIAATSVAIAVVFAVLVGFILWLGRQERRELEDRLMAVSQPVALISHKAHQDNSPAVISYVGENADDDD